MAIEMTYFEDKAPNKLAETKAGQTKAGQTKADQSRTDGNDPKGNSGHRTRENPWTGSSS
jgi:hypothetical protein